MSIAAGLGVGFLLLKLFYGYISRDAVADSFRLTGRCLAAYDRVFGAMFIVVAISSTYVVLRRSVVELVRSVRKPKATPGCLSFGWLLVCY